MSDVRDRIVAYARRNIGARYSYVPSGGVEGESYNCSYLTTCAYRAAGLTIPRWQGHQNGDGSQSDWVWRSGHWTTDPDQLRPGDLVFFGPSRLRTTHVGVSLGGRWMIDSVPAGGVQTRLLYGSFVGGGWPHRMRLMRLSAIIPLLRAQRYPPADTPHWGFPAVRTVEIGGKVKRLGYFARKKQSGGDGLSSAYGSGVLTLSLDPTNSSGLLVTCDNEGQSITMDKTAQDICDALSAGIMPVFRRTQGTTTNWFTSLSSANFDTTPIIITLANDARQYEAASMSDYPRIDASGSN